MDYSTAQRRLQPLLQVPELRRGRRPAHRSRRGTNECVMQNPLVPAIKLRMVGVVVGQGLARRRSARRVRRGLSGVLSIALVGCAVDDREFEPSMAVTPNEAASGASEGSGAAGPGPLGARNAGGGGGSQPALPDELDLLFMIDNSRSMADKQEILRLTTLDLMSRLVNPICLDDAGNEHPAPPPGAACPPGQRRQFEPIGDIHVGIITSSLGDFGANVACGDFTSPSYTPDRVDMAHLMGSLERGGALDNEKAFLTYRTGSDLEQFNAAFQNLVSSVGENGCGWEASLESWFRFLIDPRPYQGLTRVPCSDGITSTDCVAPSTDALGQPLFDQGLLAQRAAFLRPRSLVAVVMLTDENDCSVEPVGQNWAVTDIASGTPMARGTTACAANPNDPCCRPCGTPAPAGCSDDPSCGTGVMANRLPPEADGFNLRCFDQKRRFGHDFLFPTRRYVNALQEAELCLDHSDLSTPSCPSPLVPNPLFAGGRTPERVLLAGIVGVPWQSIASGTDSTGRALSDPGRQLRYKSSSELTSADWNRIVGSAGTLGRIASDGVLEIPAVPPSPPSEPTMVESSAARANVTPGNPINGREHDTASGGVTPDDLQFACIFPLPTSRDCAQVDPTTTTCDCFPGESDSPLCETTPANGSPGTIQFWAKAYPGLRQLRVLQGLGDRSVVSSICARQTNDVERPDFGYRPAVAALVEGLDRLRRR
jgi:hypothetical protein